MDDHVRKCEFNPTPVCDMRPNMSKAENLTEMCLSLKQHAQADETPDSLKWKDICNFRTFDDDVMIVKTEKKFPTAAFAQSSVPVSQTDAKFKVKIMKFDPWKYIAVGLTSKGHEKFVIPGLLEGSIGFDSEGDVIVKNVSKQFGRVWKAGDIIECGFVFSSDVSGDECAIVTISIVQNKQFVGETTFSMLPKVDYFPSVYVYEGVVGSWWKRGEVAVMDGTDTKIQFFRCP